MGTSTLDQQATTDVLNSKSAPSFLSPNGLGRMRVAPGAVLAATNAMARVKAPQLFSASGLGRVRLAPVAGSTPSAQASAALPMIASSQSGLARLIKK